MSRTKEINDLIRRIPAKRFQKFIDGGGHWCVVNKNTGLSVRFAQSPRGGGGLWTARERLRTIGYIDQRRPKKKRHAKRCDPKPATPTTPGSVPMPSFSDVEVLPAQQYPDAPTIGSSRVEAARYVWRVICGRSESRVHPDTGVRVYRWEGRIGDLITEIWPALLADSVSPKQRTYLTDRIRDYLVAEGILENHRQGNRNKPTEWLVSRRWNGQGPEPIETAQPASEPVPPSQPAAEPSEPPADPTPEERPRSVLERTSLAEMIVFIEDDYERLSAIRDKIRPLLERQAELAAELNDVTAQLRELSRGELK